MSGHAGRYQKLVLVLTILNIFSIVAFQFVLIAHPPYGRIVKPQGTPLERYLRYAGLIRLDGLDWVSYLRILLPEVLVLISSVVTYVVCLRLNPASGLDDQLLQVSEPPPAQPPPTEGDKVARQRKLSLLTSFGKYVCMLSLCFAGILRPSILSGVYFLVFLGSMTWWGLNKTLGKPFAWICRCLLVLLVCHVTALFLYQMEWAQVLLPSDHPVARYLGLGALMITDTADPRVSYASSLDWDSFANPLVLVWLYFIICYESNLIINAPDTSRPVEDEANVTVSSPMALTEATPLIRGRESLYRRGTSRRGLIQDSMGSVTLTEMPEETIKEETISEEEAGPGVLEIILNAGITISQLLAQSSYIATNIIMMAWSITYHSWLTFVLLLWASIMWLMPNQRRAMLRSSPFLVFYATCLLLAQYIYGMNLTNEELPQTVQGLNLKQIGLEKVLYLPFKPLIIKILFTVMFWITLKQYNQEKWEARNQSALADIASPLQIGVTTATGVSGESQTKTSLFVKRFGTICRSLLTKFWIWIVASILFTIGISGDRVTIFRIIYMAMALIFILTFQLSWTLWRKMMYGFWLVLILYSMLILVMTYTYQFDNFDAYWEEYLRIPKQLQKDIGLERYETTELFVKLLTPTFFVVITVIQLYYFHNDFLAISDIKSRGSSIRPRTISDVSRVVRLTKSERSTETSTAPEIITPIDETEELSKKKGISIKRAIIEIRIKTFTTFILRKLVDLIELIWLFLELHMLKFVMIALMVLSVVDVCVLHFMFVALVVVGIVFGTRVQTIVVHISSFLISIAFLSKMIYQINYIDHNQWNVTCPGDNETYNTAEWIGFDKVGPATTLPLLLKGYIVVILIITFHSVIIRRQKYQRHLRGRHLSRPFIMFPRINYRDVDNNVTSCIKYLFNYGFYRFGVEVCLIAIVTLIGLRMDFYAVLYSFWLCLLITPNRRVLSSIWPFFTLFIVVTIPFQYALAIGFPPFMCFVYPWDQSETLERLQEWMFFPDRINPPEAYKLLCDFIVLLLVCRQGVVFRTENRHRNFEYPGGTNKSILHHFEEQNFINPTPDFISFTRSWLDVIKRIVLSGFIWVTLAIVFLAGTNRVNIFSLGYLIGAFIFLWQGNDFYLRPIRSILKWWNFLIGYNVTVIMIKALLQILGCIYIKEMQLSACWAVQILGVACIKKFGTSFRDISVPGDCSVPRGEVGLAWDGCCFVFLILQRRLFNSYYFFHIVDEAKAMTVLASRGAELIEELAHRQVMAQQESEKRILEKIKNKMDRIKASQKKIQGPNFQEPSSHFVAIRSGDYYMFEDVEEEVDLLLEESSSESSTEYSDEAIDSKRANVGEFLSTALKTDIRKAAELAMEQNREADETVRREKMMRDSEKLQRKRNLSLMIPSTSEKERWRRTSLPEKADQMEPVAGPSGLQPSDDGRDEGDRYPSTPGAEEVEGEEEEGEVPPPWKEKLSTFIKFLWALIESVMVSVTTTLNKFSRDYRYVMRTLSVEKKQLKANKDFGIGLRPSPGHIWRPHPLAALSKPKSSQTDPKDKESSLTSRSLSPVSIGEFEEEGELTASEQPPLIRLLLAMWFAVLSHSELVCYFTIFLHQIRSPTILSLPLPLMVFLWATLTVPRPSKNFWVTIIAYTEVVVVVKCMFQFEIIPWNQKLIPDNAPFAFPRIIGIERQPGMYAYYDLLLLLVVFFHRSMLKSLGLWKETPRNVHVPSHKDSPSSETTELSSSEQTQNSKKESTVIQTNKDNTVKDLVVVGDNTISRKEYFAALPLKGRRFHRPWLTFFSTLLESKGRVTTDVYAYMFFCDFFNFLVVIFGFAAFGSQQGDGGVSQYFEENKVPIAFLVMLILQFGLIIIDRTLYLRKFILGKIIFQFVLVVGIHIWMFFVLPAVTDRQFNAALPPQMWYMVKCFYLLLSAYQIRCGYPSRIFGNFLCKSYNYINMFLFKVFMAVPFVFELRALMDWIWTDTSMTLSDWLKMEDIFAHVFQLKCQRRAEKDYPQPRGEKKNTLIKYIVGGGCLIGIIAVIWFPLVLFALGNTVGQPNIPTDVSLKVKIGSYTPIYQYTAENYSIFSLTESMWEKTLNVYQKSRPAQTFLSNYEFDDVGVAVLSAHSTVVWTISPPDKEALIKDLQSNRTISVRMDWTISRKSTTPDQPGIVTNNVEQYLSPNDSNREILVNYITGNKTGNASSPAILPHLLPKFVKVTSRGTATVIPQLMNFDDDSHPENIYRSLEARLLNINQPWWEIKEKCGDPIYTNFLSKLPFINCNRLVMYTFNDKAFPATLNIISGKGIIGLYTTFVIVIHSVIRGFFTGISFKIMFDDMPNVDRLLQLCLDIYLVRESGELDLEEDLFAKLVFLYRSPETLIKWTRPPEEIGDDEPDAQPELNS
ncbi:hypothetical protein O3M35_005299 [Rhynocoris fuscipes]|uniref:Piezo-type mechanosensitive ion channel component n=1 Tax=Rhynocoris fuscipes TaxID=488301 RepID=A0AAW1DKH1_9HEMI